MTFIWPTYHILSRLHIHIHRYTIYSYRNVASLIYTIYGHVSEHRHMLHFHTIIYTAYIIIIRIQTQNNTYIQRKASNYLPIFIYNLHTYIYLSIYTRVILAVFKSKLKMPIYSSIYIHTRTHTYLYLDITLHWAKCLRWICFNTVMFGLIVKSFNY